jgi:predicted small metal-binding protein
VGSLVEATRPQEADVRVIDCDCGKTLHAANDDDLLTAVRTHIEEDHPELEMDDDKVRGLIVAQAYEASDA